MAGSRRGTLALFATLALSLATAIAAAAWLIVTTENTSVTIPTTADAHATAPTAPTATAAQPASALPTHHTASTLATSATSATSAATGNDAAVVTATVAQATTQQAAAPSASSGAGQRAFIDPVTGQLRQPEHDELAAIAAATAAAAPARRLARTANAAQEFFVPDGSIAAVVPEELHTFTVATRGPDGRIVIEHAQGEQNAVNLMKANSAKKSPLAPVSRAQQKEDRNDR